MRTTNLFNYLKRFRRIAWYPSSGGDATPVEALSKRHLHRLGFDPREIPDCFLFTDYLSYTSDGSRFFLDLAEWEETAEFYIGEGYEAIAHNIEELPRLRLGFYRDMVEFDHDQHYGRVFVCDLLIKRPDQSVSISKLVYVIAENTVFAHEFLLKHKLHNIGYVIHSRYGFGFGGGRSTGVSLTRLFKDLGVMFFFTDTVGQPYGEDVASRYLTPEQKSCIPVLHSVGYPSDWDIVYGNGPTLLYEVVAFTENPDLTIHYELEK